MSFIGSPRGAARLPPNNIMDVNELERINAAAAATAAAAAAAANGNNQALHASGNEFILAAVSSSINLPGFWLEKPSTWFNMCESAFAVRQITSSTTKYHHCVGKLPAETVATVEDIIDNYTDFADPYTELKQRLCRAYGRSEMQKVNDLLDLPNLGSEKPSVLMDNILSLWPDTSTRNSSKLLLGLFLRRLPLQMRSQLANFPATTPAQLAAAADAIWSQSGGQVSAAAVTVAAATSGRPRSPSPRPNANGNRGRNSTPAPKRGSGGGGGAPRKQRWKDPVPGLCFYHCNFGARATKCEHGCQYTPN